MSDIVSKIVTIGEAQETKERKFKKTSNLRLKISSATGQSPETPTSKTSKSFSALEELLQCGICLERLSHPRMLPCQHTFCLSCLKTHVAAKNLKVTASNDPHSKSPKFTVNGIKSMSCPICQRTVELNEGLDSVDNLPKNLYLQSLLKVVEGSPASPKVVENFRCVNCQTVSQQQEQVCQHCLQIFCNICWSLHLAELQENLSLLVKQLGESEKRLKHKLESFSSRCDALEEKVKQATKIKVEEILREEKRVYEEVNSIKKEGSIASDILLDGISKLQKDILSKSQNKNDSHKVTTYMNLHKETSKILDQVNYFGQARITFDPDTFKLDQISEAIYNDDVPEEQQQQQQTLADHQGHYKSRSFTPKLLWTKCPTPAGIGIAPWDDTKLYVATTEKHSVLVLNRTKFKLIDRLTHEDMSCPSGLAFSLTKKEVFVSDKWNYCIHVFSHEGCYLRNICNKQKLRGPDGLAMGPNNELIICDVGNDRVLIVDPETDEKVRTIGIHNGFTQLNFPTGVAVYGSTIVIADSGNHRVKMFNLHGDLLHEIGSFGKNPGQFRSPEVVAVDPNGFILVGDAGNARVQVFTSDGRLVKIFGSKGGFGWVSGLLITPELDIIASDHKTRSLRIF